MARALPEAGRPKRPASGEGDPEADRNKNGTAKNRSTGKGDWPGALKK